MEPAKKASKQFCHRTPRARHPAEGAHNVAEVLRRAEGGEQFTITVAGRPVAHLGPARRRQRVSGPELAKVRDTPATQTLTDDLERFSGNLTDPFAQVRALHTSVLIGADDPGALEGAISATSLAELHFGVVVAPGDDARARRALRPE